MSFKRILPAILLIAGIILACAVFTYQKEIQSVSTLQFEILKTHFDNFFFAWGPNVQRRKPFSTIKKETELKLYIGQPFRDFERKDWNEFWELAYGAYPKEPPEKEGLPYRVRQLTEEEIALALQDKYYNPFMYFQASHWRGFFDLLFSK